MTRIKTAFECPPIPDRSHDYRAWFDWFNGDDNQPTGWGETEDDAVLDLLNQAAEVDDDGSCADELVNLAFAGWKTRADLQPVVKELDWKATTLGFEVHTLMGKFEVLAGNYSNKWFWWDEAGKFMDQPCGRGVDFEDCAEQVRIHIERHILSALTLAPVTPAQAAEWQDIETAPVGYDVLLWSPEHKIQIADFGGCLKYNQPGYTHWMPLPEPPEASHEYVTAVDMEGVTVRAGDKVAFSYGIPPVRVEGVLFERDGDLIMPTPDHTPKEGTLAEITKHTGGFWKVGASQDEYAIAEGGQPWMM